MATWRLTDPGQGAHGGGSDRTGGDEATVAPDHLAQQILSLLATSRPAEVGNPGLCAGLH